MTSDYNSILVWPLTLRELGLGDESSSDSQGPSYLSQGAFSQSHQLGVEDCSV